jgi:hypothetical protein
MSRPIGVRAVRASGRARVGGSNVPDRLSEEGSMMSRRDFVRSMFGVLVIGIALAAVPGRCRAGGLIVDKGYDLFQTTTGSSFPGLGDLVGVPLGKFNFGSGAVGVGTTDTIIQRLDDVTVAAAGDTGSTRLLVNALQLETATQVDFMNLGMDNYFVTLQSTHGGPKSTGTMDITFASAAGGTFTSTLDMNFDIRKHSLNGNIVASLDLMLSNSGASWGRIPPAAAELINGINYKLNGTDTSNDFWVTPPLIEKHPGGGQHQVRDASVPEPATWVMGATAMVIGLAYAKSRGKRRNDETRVQP